MKAYDTIFSMENLISLQTSLLKFASTLWMTTREAAPYMIFGLFLAGLLHIFVPSKIIFWALSKKGFKGAFRAALLGAPLPLCSCSVLPTAITLHRKGASKASTFSFMISTPETSIDSLAITFALLPSAFLGIRPFAAVILAIGVGVIIEKLSSSKNQEDLKQNLRKFLNYKVLNQTNNQKNTYDEICKVCGILENGNHHHGFISKFKAVFSYAFKTFFDDIGFWILIGLVVAAGLNVFIPEGFLNSAFWAGHTNLQIILAILIGIPLYSCATASTPIAATLMLKGLSPGAALAFLLSGPATNISTYFILKKEFGSKIVFLFFASLAIICFALALALNEIWPFLQKMGTWTFVPNVSTRSFSLHIPGWIEVISAWIMIVLLMRQLILKFYTVKSHTHDEHENSNEHADDCCK